MLRGLLGLVLLLAVLYIGSSYGRPLFRAWRFRDAMTQHARLSTVGGGSDTKRELLEIASDLGVPLEPERLVVRGGSRKPVSIAASWDEIVTIEGGPLGTWVDTLDFDFEVSSTGRDGR